MDWVPILRYSDFYDVPHWILIRYRGLLFVLDSPLLEKTDDYSGVYQVYRVPEDRADSIGELGWATVAERLQVQIPVAEVVLDDTRRGAIRADSLKRISELLDGKQAG